MKPLIGIVANARGSWPTMAQFDDLAVGVVRTIVYDNDELDAALQDVPPGVRVIALLNNEHRDVRSDWSGWDDAVLAFAQRFHGRVWAVECGNEWDLHGIPVADACRRTNAALGPLHDHGIRCIHGSVAGSDWQQALTDSAGLLNDGVDGVCLHPYGQRITDWSGRQPNFSPGMGAAVRRAYDLTGLPVYVTEFGAKLRDYAIDVEPQRQADYVREAFAEIIASGVCAAACYFCWRDDVAPAHEQGRDAFGLSMTDSTQRPGWAALRAVAQSHQEEPVPEFKLGFGILAGQLGRDVVGVPLEDEHPAIVQKTSAGWMVYHPGTQETVFLVDHKAARPGGDPVDRLTALGDIWTAYRDDIPYNPDAAIVQYWTDLPVDIGSPLGPEHPTTDGGVEQAFTGAILRWHPDRGVERARW